MRTRSVAIGILGLALLAGCGGDDNDDGGSAGSTDQQESAPSGAGPLSKQEFIRRGDALCRDFRSKSPDTGNPDSFEELKKQVDDVLPAAQETLRKFEQLEPPKGDEKVIEDYLETQRDQLALIRQMGEAAESNDEAAVQRYAADVRETGQKAKGIAQGYGFKVCGSDEASA